MAINNPRKSPLRVRKGTKKEFTRVLNLIRVQFEAKIDKIEDRLDALESKARRKRAKKPVKDSKEETKKEE